MLCEFHLNEKITFHLNNTEPFLNALQDKAELDSRRALMEGPTAPQTSSSDRIGAPLYTGPCSPSVRPLSTTETGPNTVHLYLGLFLQWLPQALGKVFRSIKGFLIPRVEPETGFYYFPLKQVELSRDNLQTVDRRPGEAPWRGEEEPARGQSLGTAPLHTGTFCRGRADCI